jgi:alcohol dehydrogenase
VLLVVDKLSNPGEQIMLPEYFEFCVPTRVIYGIGILSTIKNEISHFGHRRAILVTDKILMQAGPVDLVKAGFQDSNIAIVCVFDDVPPNSTISTVTRCAATAKEHECDLIIAIGGGSVIDTAKVANILIKKGGQLTDHMGAYLLDKHESLLPSIFIPTTAGTGSEVTKVAVIADLARDLKLPFAEEQFLPQMAILDPTVTASMPAKLTAATGMDALTHAIEAYADKEWSPASDALALHAIRLISTHILAACAHPEDMQARGAMLTGSFLAGIAFSHSMVGMVHGISHALGGVYHIPHGLANALVLPEVMHYNLNFRLNRYAEIAQALGIAFPRIIDSSRSVLKSNRLWGATQNFSPLDPFRDWLDAKSRHIGDTAANVLQNFGFIDDWIGKQMAYAGIEKIQTLNRQLAFLTGMPLNLKDAGIDDNLDKLDQVVQTALEDGAMLYNPREPDSKSVMGIIRKLYHAKTQPLPITEKDLAVSGARKTTSEMTQVFKDADMLYRVLVAFYERLKNDPTIGPGLKETGLCIQFVYKNPTAIITIDARGDELRIASGDFDGEPEVTMTMDADFAHKFWHGQANLVTALTRRQVVARGNIPKTIKLLPLLRPAFELYPRFLREKGLGNLVI